MSRWILCLTHWSHLHHVKEYCRNQSRYAYRPVCRATVGVAQSVAAMKQCMRRGGQATSRGMTSGARDSGGSFTGVEQLEPRLLLSGDVSGSVFGDWNADGLRDLDESGRAGIEVYVDSDADGVLDVGETSVLTDVNGDFTFVDLADGNHQLAVQLPEGWNATQPMGAHQVVAVALMISMKIWTMMV